MLSWGKPAHQIGQRLLCSTSVASSNKSLVAPRDAQRFVTQCLEALGARHSSASLHADVLVEADCQGHFSHGINRLDGMYVKEIRAGLVNLEGEPHVLKESESTAWVDGDNTFGTTVGMFCMELAMKKAKETGVGWVTTKGSNHFGITGWYSAQALRHNFIGVAFTNTTPLTVPTRAQDSALGTNTISVAAPAVVTPSTSDSFLLDMATSTVALGKVEMAYRSQQPLPPGWLFSKMGVLPADEGELLRGVGTTYFMYPLGGEEATAGYKGYGLAMMVEILCGVLGGSAIGPNIRSAFNPEAQGVANLGQTFVAVNPAMFAAGFQQRLSTLLALCRDSLPLPGGEGGTVIVPGDKEKRSKQLVEAEGGIRYDDNVLAALETLASQLNVPPIQRVHAHS